MALWQGAAVLLVLLAAYAWAVRSMPTPEARAFGFALLVFANILLVFSHRAPGKSLLASLGSMNRMVALVASSTCGLLLLILYVPLLNHLLGFAPLAPLQLLLATAITLAGVVLSGVVKAWRSS